MGDSTDVSFPGADATWIVESGLQSLLDDYQQSSTNFAYLCESRDLAVPEGRRVLEAAIATSDDLRDQWSELEAARERLAAYRALMGETSMLEGFVLGFMGVSALASFLCLLGPLWDQLVGLHLRWAQWNLRAAISFVLMVLLTALSLRFDARKEEVARSQGLSGSVALVDRREAAFTELLDAVAIPRAFDLLRDTGSTDATQTDVGEPVVAEEEHDDESEPEASAELHMVQPSWSPVLSPRVAAHRLVETAVFGRLILELGREGGTCVGLAGERGSGKSELIRFACERDPSIERGGALGIVVPAPVAYDPTTFLRHVLLKLCAATPHKANPMASVVRSRVLRQVVVAAVAGLLIAAGWYAIETQPFWFSPTYLASMSAVIGLSAVYVALMLAVVRHQRTRRRARQTVRRVEAGWAAQQLEHRVRYTEKLVHSGEFSAAVSGLGAKLIRGRDLTELPLTEADLVQELAEFVAVLSDAGYEVRIGIDELDKLSNDEAAEDFLNHLKVLFPVTSASFILSLSESAWSRFASRNVSLRDAFDSSLDNVIRVPSLTFEDAERIFDARGAELPPSQVLFCFAVSGGLPRELLRVARELVDSAADLQVPQFSDAGAAVLYRYLADSARSLLTYLRETDLGIETHGQLSRAATSLIEAGGWEAAVPCSTAILQTPLDVDDPGTSTRDTLQEGGQRSSMLLGVHRAAAAFMGEIQFLSDAKALLDLISSTPVLTPHMIEQGEGLARSRREGHLGVNDRAAATPA